MKLSNPTRIFIGLVTLAGLGVTAYGISNHVSFSWQGFLVILAAAMISARFKVTLPKLNGSMSVTLPFILLAFSQLSFLEALIVTLASVVAQSVGFGKTPKPIQLLFNCSTVAVAIGLCHFAVAQLPAAAGIAGKTIIIGVAGVVYFFANTLPVAGIISLTDNKNVVNVWNEVFLWSFPYYVVSAGLASMVISLDRQIWQTSLAVLVIAFGLYRSFATYTTRSQGQSAADSKPARSSAATA